MLEKAKDFICGCLNAERKGIIYFGVGDHGEILGLEIEDMKDEIVTAFQSVLNEHIKSDGANSLSMGEQDCIKRHFIPVKNEEGNPTRSYVIEIEVARDWMPCKDNVYYSKTWKKKVNKKDNNNKVVNSKALRDFFDVKPANGMTLMFAMMARLALSRKKKCTKSNEVGTCWRKLAPELGIDAVACELIEEDHRGKSAEKATQLLIHWKRLESRNATVGTSRRCPGKN
ncbi:hypothetical protein OS493_038919 [Desmophyllum pertusum]|uniref:Death domain-containing protein n=1 Tax=Desmophyllum pertusum TaxID=174260 RepID=A0A9W9YHC0_9CNID|nr:hypothetical protein OS493_038919 [Desmophyllum pertusum]